MIKNDIYITGHKNPDTDSICASIAYAHLKNKLFKENYIAARAGRVNEESKFVLDYFKLDYPKLITDVRPQVIDIEINRVNPVKADISLKTAWNTMIEKKTRTLAVVNDENEIVGVITGGDITNSYMAESDSNILAVAQTPIENLIHTLDANVLVDFSRDKITDGKVIVAAANPDIMEQYIKENDIVIVGNRYETQLCAIEMGCSCIIVSYGSPVSKTIQKIAKSAGCAVLTSPYDTFTIARIINQSIPIGHFMTTNELCYFDQNSYLDDIQSVMIKKRFREFPIVEDGKYIGLISRRNLLEINKKRVIMVDHNEKNQAVNGIEACEVMEIIDHHKIATLETPMPIYFRNQPVGCTSTIVYMMYKENNIEIPKNIAGALCSAIISDTLLFRSPTCTQIDKDTCQKLASIAEINLEEYSQEMFKAGANLEDKSAEEIFLQDFKKFKVGSKYIGIGQINIMGKEFVDGVKAKLLPYLKDALSREQVDIIYFMLTDIFSEITYLIFTGEDSRDIIRFAYKNAEVGEEIAILKNVVSRKKQMVPSLINGISEFEDNEK